MNRPSEIYLQREVLEVANVEEAVANESRHLLIGPRRKNVRPFEASLFKHAPLTFLVGEAGLGKTMLLHRLVDSAQGGRTESSIFLSLRSVDCSNLITEIEAFRSAEGPSCNLDRDIRDSEEIVALDGLDEIPQHEVLDLQRSVTRILAEMPNWRIVISSRTAVLRRYWSLFSACCPPIWQLTHFSDENVMEYMRLFQVEEPLIERAREWLRLDRGTTIVTVPRYLNYICELLVDPVRRNVREVPRLSALFQSVIDRELNHEVSKKGLVAHSRLIERILAKLALVMEIAQLNSITGDELLTFFDSIGSDLKVPFLAPDLFIELTEQILKFDGAKYEFQNRELQEFLAATEVIRLSNPQRIIFSLCYDEHSALLNPSWHNCLRFAFDLMPALFADIVPYLISAAYRPAGTFLTLDEGFWRTAPIFRDGEITVEQSELLYLKILPYFQDALFWIEYDAVFSLASIFNPSSEKFLLNSKANLGDTPTQARVRKSNLARLIGEIRSAKGAGAFSHDWPSWLLSLIQDPLEDRVVVRTALWAIRNFRNENVLENLRCLVDRGDQFVREAVAQVCSFINPDHPTSIELNLQLFEKMAHGSFEGLMSCKTIDNQIRIISEFASKETLTHRFLEEMEYYSALEGGFLPTILPQKVDPPLRDTVTKLFIAMVPILGSNSRLQQEVLELTQTFGATNPDLVLEVAKHFAIHGDANDSWSVASGLSYLVTPVIKEEFVRFFQGSVIASAKPTFIQALDYQIARIETFRDSSQGKPVSDSHSSGELVELDEEFRGRFQSFDKQSGYRIFDELADFLDKLSRENKSLTREATAVVANSITINIFEIFDPSKGHLELNEHVSHRSWNVSTFLQVFSAGVEICRALSISATAYRDKLVAYLPFAEEEQIEWLMAQIGSLTEPESQSICERFVSSRGLKTVKMSTLLRLLSFIKGDKSVQLLKTLIRDSVVDVYSQKKLVTSLSEGGLLPESELQAIESQLTEGEPSRSELAEHMQALRISRFASRSAIEKRMKCIIERASPVPNRGGDKSFTPTPVEYELTDGSFAAPLRDVADPDVMDLYLKLLDSAFDLAATDEAKVPYADYLWDVVIKYFENLLVLKSYIPLRQLEQGVAENLHKERSNWIQAKLSKIRNAYSMNIRRPASFHMAVRSYNHCRNSVDCLVVNSLELKQRTLDCLSDQIVPWISGEGKKIIESTYRSSRQKEVALQRILKVLLLSHMNKGLTSTGSLSLLREPQLDNDTRTDLLLSYGFIGPVLIELKLSSNGDLKAADPTSSKSYLNVKDYLQGYGCGAGIFLILVDEVLSELREKRVREAFAGIPGVGVVFVLLPDSLIKGRGKALAKKKVQRKEAKQSRVKSRKAKSLGRSEV